MDDTPLLVRALWKMRSGDRIVTAAIHTHFRGWELRVTIEYSGEGDLLLSQLEKVDVKVLDDKAAEMRATLLENGWSDVADDSDTMH